MKRWLLIALTVVVGCGSSPPPKVTVKQIDPPVEKPSTIETVKEEPDAFHATSGAGDAAVQFVRDERSSRLDIAAPKTHGKEAWRQPLAIGDEAPMKAAFVLTTGNRAAAISGDAWVVFDTKGIRIAGHEMESPYMRLDRGSGAIVVDDTRAADLPPDAKLAAHKGLVVMVKTGAVYVGERAIEGKFEALDVAIDDDGVACVVVKQGAELSLWTIPISGNGQIGRHKLGKNRRVLAPPMLGKSLRALILDTGVVAYSLEGKKLWERRGVPTGGVTITSDDHVLVADGGKLSVYDHRGHAVELLSDSGVVFSTPPILTADGLLLVASAQFLHAVTF